MVSTKLSLQTLGLGLGSKSSGIQGGERFGGSP